MSIVHNAPQSTVRSFEQTVMVMMIGVIHGQDQSTLAILIIFVIILAATPNFSTDGSVDGGFLPKTLSILHKLTIYRMIPPKLILSFGISGTP